MFGATGSYVGWALTAPLSAPLVTSQTPTVATPAAATIALPFEGASAISISGADDYLGATASGIWATSGTDESRPIASISKLITALVILDAKPLASADDPGPTISFGKAAHDLYDKYYVQGATVAKMPTGSAMSEHDALATMLIAQIVATPSLTLPGPGLMPNTNDLVGEGGVTGLKTGNLGAGSYNLLYTASLDVGAAQPLSVTGVALGGYSRQSVDRSVLAQLDSIRAGFHIVPVANRGQEIGSYSTPWRSTARMVLSDSASIFTWSDTPITATMETTTPKTYQDGEVIGTITWTAGPNTTTADVEIDGNIVPPTEWWRLTHPSELG